MVVPLQNLVALSYHEGVWVSQTFEALVRRSLQLQDHVKHVSSIDVPNLVVQGQIDQKMRAYGGSLKDLGPLPP